MTYSCQVISRLSLDLQEEVHLSMRLVRIIIGVIILGISLGVSSIAPIQNLTRTSSVYAQSNVLERSSNSNDSKSSAYHKTSFQTFEDLFKFSEPNPDNLKKSPGRDLFIIGLVLSGLLHQVLPFLFFALGRNRLSGSRISIIGAFLFFLLTTLWALGVMMTTGQVISWAIILLLIFVIWAALSKR